MKQAWAQKNLKNFTDNLGEIVFIKLQREVAK